MLDLLREVVISLALTIGSLNGYPGTWDCYHELDESPGYSCLLLTEQHGATMIYGSLATGQITYWSESIDGHEITLALISRPSTSRRE